MIEFEQFQERIRRELRAKMKFSKDLLELREKEAKLVKVKRYEEAERVKMKADLLEEFERSKLEAEVILILNNDVLDAIGTRKEGGEVETHIIVGTSRSIEEDIEGQERAVETQTIRLTKTYIKKQEYPQ